MRKAALTFLTILAATEVVCADGEGAEVETAEEASSCDWLFVNAYVDIETAFLCRGFVWDTNPFSSQYADVGIDTGPFGKFSGYVWSMLSKSIGSHSYNLRYPCTEVDYGIRYVYDLEIAEEWLLSSGVVKQWVTDPRRYSDAHSIIDWQAFQTLSNPYLTPYWRMRYIYKPFEAFYWVIGMKRSFPLFVDGLELTLDFFGDLGDGRHCRNLFGPKPNNPYSRYRGGLQSLNVVARLDYHLTEWLSIFAFVGEYSIVSGVARDAVRAMRDIEGVCDIAYGGVGLSVGF